MSYNSLTSKQIISNEGELSIDVFNSFDNPDTNPDVVSDLLRK